ncbi:MAG: alpha/beta hydrolase [Acidobacteria bacterium]|nr:alpha/beta hydrolase [Acidobacteriota bacterium]
MAPRIGLAVLRTSAIFVFLALAGATYQGTATALERRRFPHPGRLITVGDRQLHIYCLGEGTPTVVLEAPAAGMSAVWGWVQPAVAATTRVCSYDRPGLGWSEAGTAPYDPSVVPDELHELLARSGEPAPYVLAGQGLGAAFVTLFAARFAGETGGLVLLDPADPGRPAAPDATVRIVRASPWLARAGLLRMTRALSGTTEGLPDASAGPVRSFLNRPDHLTRAARELARWDDTVRLAAAAALAPDLPVVRIDVSGREPVAFLTDPSRAADVTARLTALARQIRDNR